MRRAALLAVVAFVLIMFTGIVVVNSLNVVQRVTFIDHVRGTVEARQPGEGAFKPLAGEARVLSGTVLRTGKDAGALLHWADGTRLEAGPESRLTVLKCRLDKRTNAAVSLFKLDVGRIFVRVVRALSANSKFEIHTPTATAGVRGTEFSICVSPDGTTEVLVYEGNVSVDSGGKSVGVPQGQAFMVNSAGNIRTTRHLHEAERKEWQKTAAATALLPTASK